MRKFIYSALLFAALTVTSCDYHEFTVPNFAIEAEGFTSNAAIALTQDETVKLKVVVDNTTDYQVTWTMNKEVVSQEPTFNFTATQLGMNLVTATVTSPDGGVSSTMLQINVQGKYKKGTFILNEGNMTDGTGTLIFISPKGEITDSAYYRVNHTLLGNVAQDLFIANNKMYIVTQNGTANGGEGLLIIANAETLKKEAVFEAELKGIDWPSNVAVIGEQIYIRDLSGIHTFNATTKAITYVEGTKGATKNRMAVVANKVFAPCGTNVLVLEEGKLTNKIKMPGQVSGILKADKNSLWVSCTSKPAVICKVDATSNTIVETNDLGDAKVSQGGWGDVAAPAISAKGDTIYFSNHSTLIKRHIFSQKRTEDVVQVKNYVENASMVYGNLAVDPVSGEVYITTIKGWGLDYLINSIAVFDFDNTASPLKSDYKNYTKFPGGIYFTENFK